ncbi:flagellar hook-associated protein FlgK [Sinanaerobacter sp. ZZT-01]|uniref:flagellar hook-associated protein FlgK n=1 Tax=Sinanaerobacter sp. ZZT-01 TaxID=3111540 RepID=UPI002D78B4BD|nr:flagellar hook-associated protein FlgK [Sinanaerobacter sp. ZZT-01]WRR93585.1 flagellar hook-associated protein FlgK [Sinanaerobacter sp. ZZT-01]
MLRSTFYGFTTALSALRTSQKALDVTGQNISNMNTSGYTRQRLDLYSVRSSGYGDRYATRSSSYIGQGVGVTNVSQARDPFLDVRFRREAAKLGQIDANLSVKEDLESIFDETQKTALQSRFQDLISQLQTLSDHSGAAEFDSIVRSSAESLTKLLRQYSNSLKSVREQEEYNMENVTVNKVNSLLNDIATLNKTIKESQIFGSSSLELLDQRNLLIDELSTYMNINVTTTPKEISKGIFVDELRIDLIGDNGAFCLLNDTDSVDFSYEKKADGSVHISISDTFNADGDDTTQDLTDITEEFTTGIFKGALDALNKSGEFDTPPNDIRGIGYYEKSLDLLASTFAEAFNAANSVENPSFDPSQPESPTNQRYTEYKPLFVSKTDPTGKVTAGNITIASGWLDSTYGINSSKVPPISSGDTSGANDNISYMIHLFDKDLDFTLTRSDGSTQTLFNGSFEEFNSNICNVLSLDVKALNSSIDSYLASVNSIADLRDSVSAVSLDEEGINLLHFQKSYNAAARLMTTLDEALDTIINRMGTVGL